MGNKVVSPFPTYEQACQQLNDFELKHLRAQFRKYIRTGNNLTTNDFCMIPSKCSPYLRKHFYPRLFHAMDSKKDNVIDVEEFISAVTLFRVGSIDEKIRVLFMMYETSKSTTLSRDGLRQLLIDSTIVLQKDEGNSLVIVEERVEAQREIILGMVESALCQFGVSEGRLDFQEFCAFVKVESGAQALLQFIVEIIDQ